MVYRGFWRPGLLCDSQSNLNYKINIAMNQFVNICISYFPGGFAKVKLAYHALTGDKVAVKIMDKKSLGVCTCVLIFI